MPDRNLMRVDNGLGDAGRARGVPAPSDWTIETRSADLHNDKLFLGMLRIRLRECKMRVRGIEQILNAGDLVQLQRDGLLDGSDRGWPRAGGQNFRAVQALEQAFMGGHAVSWGGKKQLDRLT